MSYPTEITNGYTVLSLIGEIDLQSSPDARDQLLELLKAGESLLVNMSQVEYLDSSGIASLVEALQYAKRSGQAFGLVEISPATSQVIKLARLDKVFPLYETVADGIAAGSS